jgi:hypothetical protein
VPSSSQTAKHQKPKNRQLVGKRLRFLFDSVWGQGTISKAVKTEHWFKIRSDDSACYNLYLKPENEGTDWFLEDEDDQKQASSSADRKRGNKPVDKASNRVKVDKYSAAAARTAIRSANYSDDEFEFDADAPVAIGDYVILSKIDVRCYRRVLRRQLSCTLHPGPA